MEVGRSRPGEGREGKGWWGRGRNTGREQWRWRDGEGPMEWKGVETVGGDDVVGGGGNDLVGGEGMM